MTGVKARSRRLRAERIKSDPMSQPNAPEPVAPVLSRRGIRLAGLAAGLVAAFTVITGITLRENGNARLREWTEAQAIPTVAVLRPDSRGRLTSLDLPGRL